MRKLRYGILSTASIVPRFINALRESRTGEAVAIASRSLEKANQKAQLWNIPKTYGSYEELCKDPDIDVVYVAMINSEHYRNAYMALSCGKHVVCEKPFALKASEAQHLFAYAREQNLFIVEAQKVVFLPTIHEIKSLIQSGALGRIHLVDLTSSCSSVYNDWLHSKAAGGGALYGNASYSLHLVQFLFDCPIISYTGTATRIDSEVDEQCVINLKMENQVLVVSKISTNVEAINKAYIYGELGYIEIPDYWKARTAHVHYKTGEQQIIFHPCEFELTYEAAHFNDCIQNGLLQSPVMTESITVNTLEIMQHLQEQFN